MKAHTVAAGALIQLVNGGRKESVNIDDLVELISQKVLEKISSGNLINEAGPRPVSLNYGVNPVMLRNLAKQSKLSSMQKKSNSDLDDLMFQTKTVARLTRCLGDESRSTNVFQESIDLVKQIQANFTVYQDQERILQRGFIKKIIYRGSNDIDRDAHADKHSELVEAQCKLAQIFDDNEIPASIRNEFYALIPTAARDIYAEYLRMVN